MDLADFIYFGYLDYSDITHYVLFFWACSWWMTEIEDLVF